MFNKIAYFFLVRGKCKGPRESKNTHIPGLDPIFPHFFGLIFEHPAQRTNETGARWIWHLKATI